ncbi:conserved hypothetical protein [Theileria orientalis strain Shintoku]|uniref:Uncharacterized protein n=1 Tax=Theileria orientalis strain Shintoku TaxID=869250 RepID=J4D8Z2_THEOR|nr:conserved hypothetical protein [Theileria orientalis strain Shintoku]BAM41095.1 conserved hypothetical protein [Theileria orientalis strain Shintoku]|eukprot:XP_009691396.1 conserved hypothetical protein [Theileria orientalis strain Shintoku]
MNFCFIYSFVASYNLLSNSSNLPLLSRKHSNRNTFDDKMFKGVSPFRINRRTTVEIKIDDTLGNRIQMPTKCSVTGRCATTQNTTIKGSSNRRRGSSLVMHEGRQS